MQKALAIVICPFAIILTMTACGFDCVDKKTGMSKSSQTLKEAKANNLFRFDFIGDKSSFKLDSGLVFNIKDAWVENRWRYECIDDKAQIIKDSSFQFVIDADYKGEGIYSKYWLGNNHLGAVLSFDYSGQDTIFLPLYKDTSHTLTDNRLPTNIITFVKRRVSR